MELSVSSSLETSGGKKVVVVVVADFWTRTRTTNANAMEKCRSSASVLVPVPSRSSWTSMQCLVGPHRQTWTTERGRVFEVVSWLQLVGSTFWIVRQKMQSSLAPSDAERRLPDWIPVTMQQSTGNPVHYDGQFLVERSDVVGMLAS